MFWKETRTSILALWFLSAGGLLLHIRIHSPAENLFNWIPLLFGLVTALAVPVLFSFRRTVPWAYVLNLAAVIVGTVTMTYFVARTWAIPLTWRTFIFHSTLPDILILWTKLPLGQHILRLWRRAGEAEQAGGGS